MRAIITASGQMMLWISIFLCSFNTVRAQSMLTDHNDESRVIYHVQPIRSITFSNTNMVVNQLSGISYSEYLPGIKRIQIRLTTTGINALNCPIQFASMSAGGSTACQGDSILLSCTGGMSYAWTTGGTSASIQAKKSGVFDCLVTNMAGCTQWKASPLLEFGERPLLSVSTATPVICQGSSAVLSASGANSYLWQPGGNTGSALTATPAATTTYTVTGTNTSSGCTKSATRTITVNAKPTINATATTTTVCSGASITLTAYGANSYSWQPGGLSGATVGVTPTASTTYTVTGSDANGCSGTSIVAITVNSLPTVGTTVGNATICSGSSVSLAGTGASTYSWQPGGLSGTIINVTPASTTTYTVTGTALNGCINTATRLVTVNTPPAVGVTASNSGICFGSVASMTATGASTYSWQPGGLSGTTINVTPASTTTYTVTGTALNGCTATATVTITVNTSPSVGTTVTNAAICSGASTVITGTGASTYSWQPGGLNGTMINVIPSATTTYTVNGTDVNGCTATATVTITVNTPPSVGTTVTNATICSGVATMISGTGASTYSWQPGGLSGTTINVTPASTTTYTVTGTALNGCIGSATKLITVNASPSVGTTVSNATFCSGSSASITGTGAATYSWQPGGLSGTTINVTPASTTTFTVTGTALNGCIGSATKLITVNASPSVGTTVSNATICSGSSASITGTGASTYSWQPGGLSGTTITVNPASTTTYTVTGTNTTSGCANTATRTITVNSLPTITTTTTASTVCLGSGVTMTASWAGSYIWQPGGYTGSNYAIIPPATTTYTVTGTNTFTGCSNTATRTITVNALPAVAATVTTSIVCPGSSVVLSATGANSYTWQPGGSTGSNVSVFPSATATYTVTGTNTATGCTNTATRQVTLLSCTGTVLNLRLLIQGYYTGSGSMAPVMYNQGESAEMTITDSILVELRNSTFPYAVAATTKAILNRDGTAIADFPTGVTGSYFIVVKHRNAIQTWSAAAVNLGPSPVMYDFTISGAKAYGDNQIEVEGGIWAFRCGDLNQDENIDLIDLATLESDIVNFISGYNASDLNGDGNIDLLEYPFFDVNVNSFIFSTHP